MAGKGKQHDGRGGSGLKYLGLRNGERWWEARLTYTDPKTGKRRDTQDTFKADSKLLATQHRARLLQELKEGKPAASERKTFAYAIDELVASIKVYSSKKSWTSYAKSLKAVWGDWFLDVLTVQDMQEHLDALELATSTVNGRLALLRKTFALGVRKGWVKANLAKLVEPRNDSAERAKKDALEDPPKKALTTDEAALFLATLQEMNPEMYLLVLTMFVLGCRFAEVSALRWPDVDLETGVVRVRRGQVDGHEGPTKGKYARHPAISLRLRAELKAHRERMAYEQWPGWETLVFPRPIHGAPRRHNSWARETVAANIKRVQAKLGWTMPVATHIGRHTMITIADELASDALIRKVAGHKNEKMRLNYTAAHTARVVDLAERIDGGFRAKTKDTGG